MQTYEDIEAEYANEDPWGFKTNPEDQKRKQIIINVCTGLIPIKQKEFNTVLDLGCGEAWITKDLPAKTKFGIEISKTAQSRWPAEVLPWPEIHTLENHVDLVVATGILYPHYDYQFFLKKLIHASQYVVCCNIKDWEIHTIRNSIVMKEIYNLEQTHETEFPYREYVQKLRVFRKI